jgi:hypothetical protein
VLNYFFYKFTAKGSIDIYMMMLKLPCFLVKIYIDGLASTFERCRVC